MKIIGKQLINGRWTSSSENIMKTYNKFTGEELPYAFYEATKEEAKEAARVANEAFKIYNNISLEERANFLETIAKKIDELGDEFISLVSKETGLDETRIKGEKARTTNQLRLFANLVRRGDFLDARIETPIPDRQPVPKPDMRSIKIGLGPVVVFAPSNFPLAFSVAGGDSASAWAAGCPVIVKAHSSHPVTSDVIAQAVLDAIEETNMPKGVFGLIYARREVSAELVKAPEIKAVGFTGSFVGGMELFKIANSRPYPIPVFAEMGSVNPVILTPGALKNRLNEIAEQLAFSVTLGAGQFCTNPGLLIGIGEDTEKFADKLAELIKMKGSFVMLNSSIFKSYVEGIKELEKKGLKKVAQSDASENRAPAAVFKAEANLLKTTDSPLEDEIFGPTTTVVTAKNKDDIITFVNNMRGQLTSTLFIENDELDEYKDLVQALENKVGRLIINGIPTGLEVCETTVHGGPFPATTDARFTSVGTMAIERFLRPVCYQNCPDKLLPPALQNDNPLGIMRLVNGKYTTDPIK